MFDFLARRHHQKPRTKARSSLDISAPFDFRVEAHIEPESSVKHVLNYVNYGTDRGRTRPNLLVPYIAVRRVKQSRSLDGFPSYGFFSVFFMNGLISKQTSLALTVVIFLSLICLFSFIEYTNKDPNWPTAGRMQRLSRAPLTDEELRASPFGRLLPPICSRLETSSLNCGTATVPSTPIPKAPSRYRNKIPSQWIEEDEFQVTPDDRPPLQRTHSKSLPHIATWNDDVSSRCTCEVCKMGTITNKIYFPSSTLQPKRNEKTLSNRRSMKGEYDEIDTQDTIDDPVMTVVQKEPDPAQSSSGCATRPKLNTVKTPPSPPPRGVPCKNMFREPPLDFSPIRTVSCVDSDIFKDLPNRDNVSEREESPPSSYGRPSMDSGISDKHSEDEEIIITRL